MECISVTEACMVCSVVESHSYGRFPCRVRTACLEKFLVAVQALPVSSTFAP